MCGCISLRLWGRLGTSGIVAGGSPRVLSEIPPELSVVYRSEDGYEAVKLVMDDYELAGENEWFLDDLEDSHKEQEESEYGMMNDDDDEANQGREDEESFRFGADTEPPETESEAEVEDEADNIQAFMNNERRGEIATLEGHISDYNDRMANETSPSGIMTFITLINMAEGRCRELREQIANSRQS